MKKHNVSRRSFLKSTAALASISIVPRYVLGGAGFIAPSDKITFGVIGTGKQSIGLAKRFGALDEAMVVAASDVQQSRYDNFKNIVEKFYSEEKGTSLSLRSYPMFEELLDQSDIDAVIIATPDHWHANPTIMAAQKGKDIYCEKPLSHTIEEGRLMVDAATKYKRILQTGSMQRSREGFRNACELVRNGYLGELKKVIVSVGDPAVKCDLPKMDTPANIDWDRWIGPAKMRSWHPKICPSLEQDSWAMWREYEEFGGGILSDWGAHMFDIAQWGMGTDDTGPVKIIPPTDKGATRGCRFIYENGLEMVHEDFGRGWAVRFIGEEGELDVSRKFFETRAENIKDNVGKGDIKLYKSDNHYQDTIDAIKNRTEPICPGEIGHRSASICQLGNIAYDLRKPLNWDPVKEEFDNSKANKMRGKKYRSGYELIREV
ncbi:MAG: Gfo/Idh/MocA family oxidoreductase [Cyclobacteriaceae bacterium]